MVNHFVRYQTKPNATVQAPVHCTTRRFYTWLFCVAYSPPPRTYMNGGREERKRERGKAYYCTRISSYNTPFALGPKHKMQRPDPLCLENLFSTPFSVHPGHYYGTKSKHFVTKSVHHFGELFYTVLLHFTPDYWTVHHIALYFLTIG